MTHFEKGPRLGVPGSLMALEGRILIAGQCGHDWNALRSWLDEEGFQHDRAADPKDAQRLLEVGRYDLAILDLDDFSKAKRKHVVQIANEQDPDLPIVMVTGRDDQAIAVFGVQAGAYDFLLKPLPKDVFLKTVRKGVSHGRLLDELSALRSDGAGSDPSSGLIGSSESMVRLRKLIARIGPADVSVLIEGESGTGKELVAKALHRASGRDGPFEAVNCAAMPEALLESELFGHTKGAFTDAKRARDGLFVRANGGTVLLDELGEMPLSMQPKLLRVLQEEKVRPVGASSHRSFDTRILAATNKNLEAEVEAGEFRDDLFYRLNVIRIVVPPLRARGDDILLLAQHFLRRFAESHGRSGVRGFSSAAARVLLRHAWPGNVRELENSVERAVLMTRHEEIQVGDLPDACLEAPASSPTDADWFPTGAFPPLREVEEAYMRHVIDRMDGNISRAAEVLGINRRTIYRRLKD